MKDAREIVQPGDLVAVHTNYKPIAGIAKKWTDSTFQYYSIIDYSDKYYGPNTLGELKNYFNKIPPNTYIRSRVSKRVVPISEDILNEFEKYYYEQLEKELS